ncbi:MAG TPA: hydrolase [Armatimonadetes bacterium]|nr:hydrolase [Armatimonadota bacterium]
MPEGRVHNLVNLTWLILVLLAVGGGWGLGWLEIGWLEVMVFAGTYLFMTFFLSPDLDLEQCNSRRHWSVLSFLWKPYAFLFRHRGVSHHWLWGPLTRLIYLMLWALPVLYWGQQYYGWSMAEKLRQMSGRLWIALGTGVYLPHWLHVILDRLE